MADDDRQSGYQSSPPSQWGHSPHIYPHSHHGTPAQEYSGFNFGTPQLPMESGTFSSNIQHRPMPPQLQPLIMPQWPSMLSSQSHATTYQPMFPQPVQPIQPMSIGPLQTPVSATSGRSTSTPRKTLTDSDRKRMCQYAEDHPNSKQTEIGGTFSRANSLVLSLTRNSYLWCRAKVSAFRNHTNQALFNVALVLCQRFCDKRRNTSLRMREAVLPQSAQRPARLTLSVRLPFGQRIRYDCKRDSTFTGAKGLAQEKKGFPLSDDVIRDKARAFTATTTTPENQLVLSASWIEKFKLKNNLMGARSRKGSLAPDDIEGASAAASSSHTPSGTSPVSPPGIGSPGLHSIESQESLKNESPDSYVDFGRHGPFHSQSTNSLNSAFTDTAPSSFSPGPLSPTSPFFTPDSGTAPSPFVPPLTARPILPATTANNSQRPRSQTFPLLDQYMSGSADAPTPKYVTSTMLDSPMEEPPDPLINIAEVVRGTHPEDRPHTVTPSETMRPPPLPAHILSGDRKREVTPATSSSSLHSWTSPEEAHRALEVVMSFIEQQPNGFLDFQESMHIGKLMEKLRLQSRAGS